MIGRDEEQRMIDDFLATRGATVLPPVDAQDRLVDEMLGTRTALAAGDDHSAAMRASIGRSWKRRGRRRHA